MKAEISTPQIEYALTEIGISFSESVRALGDWARAHVALIAIAQASYEKRIGES